MHSLDTSDLPALRMGIATLKSTLGRKLGSQKHDPFLNCIWQFGDLAQVSRESSVTTL